MAGFVRCSVLRRIDAGELHRDPAEPRFVGRRVHAPFGLSATLLTQPVPADWKNFIFLPEPCFHAVLATRRKQPANVIDLALGPVMNHCARDQGPVPRGPSPAARSEKRFPGGTSDAVTFEKMDR